MATPVYKVTINKIEPAANGMVYADTDITVRSGTSPNYVWTPVVNGHRTIVLEARDVMAIVNDPANSTNVLKRTATNELIRQKALEMGIDTADEAFSAMSSFYTFPYDITIRGA
jgi:hypothetical protein